MRKQIPQIDASVSQNSATAVCTPTSIVYAKVFKNPVFYAVVVSVGKVRVDTSTRQIEKPRKGGS